MDVRPGGVTGCEISVALPEDADTLTQQLDVTVPPGVLDEEMPASPLGSGQEEVSGANVVSGAFPQYLDLLVRQFRVRIDHEAQHRCGRRRESHIDATRALQMGKGTPGALTTLRLVQPWNTAFQDATQRRLSRPVVGSREQPESHARKAVQPGR
jgi:hypothetical protein